MSAAHRAILRIAAVLVPATQRSEWLAEWRSELWHVQRDPHNANVTAFCLGAFRDAFCLRCEGSCPDEDWVFAESPGRCLAWLSALGTLCVAACLLLPAARTVLFRSLCPRDLVMLAPAGAESAVMTNAFVASRPSVSREWFLALKAHGEGAFSDLAFCVPAHLDALTSKQKRGVYRNLPGGADGWLLEDAAAIADLPVRTKGFVVGRLRHDFPGDGSIRFVRLADTSLGLLGAVPVTLLFACLLFRVMTEGFRMGHLRSIGPRRGLFLGAKVLLVLPIVMFGSLDLGSFGDTVSPVFLDIAFFASMFGARWIFADQRRRCPVCLRLLANPVRIGEVSRILLEWHGTELMCLRGHGMLYVPEWPAIWSGRQRWMGLGTSWGGLFL